jgi:hypothetical protein
MKKKKKKKTQKPEWQFPKLEGKMETDEVF